MIVVRVAKFIDEIIKYINEATEGEEIEIILPNKKNRYN